MRRNITTPSWTGCCSIVGLPPSPSSMSPVHIFTAGGREIKWSRIPCLRKQLDGRDLKPGPSDPKFEKLNARPHTPSHFPGSLQVLYEKKLVWAFFLKSFKISTSWKLASLDKELIRGRLVASLKLVINCSVFFHCEEEPPSGCLPQEACSMLSKTFRMECSFNHAF